MNTKNSIWPWFVHIVLLIITACCLLPFVLLLITPVSDEQSIVHRGYSFFPQAFSLGAYRYLFHDINQILHAYGITIAITVIGTVARVIITALLAYPLSRKDMPLAGSGRSSYSSPCCSNGGLVPQYFGLHAAVRLKTRCLR